VVLGEKDAKVPAPLHVLLNRVFLALEVYLSRKEVLEVVRHFADEALPVLHHIRRSWPSTYMPFECAVFLKPSAMSHLSAVLSEMFLCSGMCLGISVLLH
jgi:hypothetical protein